MSVKCTNCDQRGLIIRQRLHDMAHWAEERREFLSKYSKDYCEKDCHIRVGGNGFRLVSVKHESPLLGFADQRKPVGTLKDIDTQFRNLDESKLKETVKLVPERRVQAWLIKQALSKNGDLTSTLGLKPPRFEKLLFALDEVSLGDKDHPPIIRCDILAVGTRGDKAFMVVIELKSSKNLKRLLIQLESFKQEVKPFQGEFERLMAKCVGHEVSCEAADIGKIIIWPKTARDSRRTIKECTESGVDVIEYCWGPDDPIESIEFSPHLIHQTGTQ